jgi:hypothetical protein
MPRLVFGVLIGEVYSHGTQAIQIRGNMDKVGNRIVLGVAHTPWYMQTTRVQRMRSVLSTGKLCVTMPSQGTQTNKPNRQASSTLHSIFTHKHAREPISLQNLKRVNL